MKSTSLSTKLIMFFLLLAVIFYFGVQGYRYLLNPTTTTLAYRYHTEDSVSVIGYVVRNETVMEGTETLLDLTHAEGERVAAGKPLAIVYRSEEALGQAQELERLTQQLEQLKHAQSAASDTEAALRLDSDIRDDIISLRATCSSGSYVALETLSDDLKTTVLKREYAYRGGDDLPERIAALSEQVNSAAAAVRGSTSQINAPFAGTYSAVVDGYETVLTPETLKSMTPKDFDSIAPVGTGSTIGKLICGSIWQFVTTLTESEASRLSEHQTLLLRMTSGVDFDLPVSVERISHAEDGRCVVVLTGSDYLTYITLLRQQNAELILDSYEGLRIPKNALRVDDSGTTGVYCLVGLTAYFKPVNVLYQGENFCLVEPGEVSAATDSQVMLYTLRAEDEVIISANDLYNGKVIN